MDMIKKTAIVAVIAMMGLPVYAHNGNHDGGRHSGSGQHNSAGNRHDVSWRGDSERSDRRHGDSWRHRDGGDWRRGHHGRVVIVDSGYGRYHHRHHHHRGNWVPGHWRYYTVCGSCRHCGCYEKRAWVPGHWVRW